MALNELARLLGSRYNPSICLLCGRMIMPGQEHDLIVVGFSRDRGSTGGQHSVLLRTKTTIRAHRLCVDMARRGIPVGQTQMTLEEA